MKELFFSWKENGSTFLGPSVVEETFSNSVNLFFCLPWFLCICFSTNPCISLCVTLINKNPLSLWRGCRCIGNYALFIWINYWRQSRNRPNDDVQLYNIKESSCTKTKVQLCFGLGPNAETVSKYWFFLRTKTISVLAI